MTNSSEFGALAPGDTEKTVELWMWIVKTLTELGPMDAFELDSKAREDRTFYEKCCHHSDNILEQVWRLIGKKKVHLTDFPRKFAVGPSLPSYFD